MKKLLYLTLLLIASLSLLPAGIMDNYQAPVETAGTYSAITGTAAGVSGDDALSGALEIGFTFNYCGTAYTQVKMSTNGWLGIGTSQTSYNLTNALASTSYFPIVAPLWDDLSSSGMTYTTLGTAPDRIFVAQWANTAWNYGGTAGQNFQVRLYETSSKIELIYGAMITPNSPSASIGINMGPGGTGNYYSITPGAPMTWSTTVENTAIAAITYLASGTTYTFNKVVATGPPNPAVLVGPPNGGWAFTDALLSWTSGGGVPDTYDVYLDTVDPPVAQVSNDQTTTTFDPNLVAGTIYYWQVIPSNGFGPATGCPVWSFKTPTATQLAESFEGTWPPLSWANTGTWSRSSSYKYHGTYSAYKAGSTTTQYLLSAPMCTITAASTLDFWAMGTSTSASLQVVYSPDRVTWTQLGSNITYAATYTWYHQVIDLSSLAGSDYYLGFRNGLTSGSNYIDYIFGPEITPLAPGPVTLSAPANGAANVNEYTTFTWTAPTTGGIPTGYRVFCDANPTPTTQIADVNALTYTVTVPFAYDSNLYWTVEAYNTAGTSAQPTPNNFTIRANPVISSFPWTEDFGSTGAAFPPLNWTRLSGLYPTETPVAYAGGWYQDDFGNVATTPPNYSGRLNIWSTSTKYWMVTPPIAIPASGYELKFDLALTTYSGTGSPTPGSQADDRFIVLISDSPLMTNPTVLQEWNNTGSTPSYDSISNTGENHILNLDAYPGTRYIAFYGESTVSGGDNNVYVDNVMVREHPAGPPNNVTLLSPADGSSGITPASVPVSWQPADSGGTPTSYFVYVSTDGTDFFGNQLGYEEVAAPATSFDLATITGVTFECLTTYYWAVQASNAAGDSDVEDPSFMIWDFTTKQQLSAPATLAMGSVWPSSVENGTIPVTNNGPGEMTFTAEGPAEFVFGATRFSVPAFSTWDLPYTFSAPAAPGAYSGTITLTETAPGSSTADIAVTATISDQVIVGTGTTDLDLPVNVFYGYTYSQTIYYPSEINYPDGYRIEKLYWYYNGYSTAETTKSYVIWMGHTTNATFASTTDWLPVGGLTQVYAGDNIPQQLTGGYWMEFVLDSPFIYNGTDNLVIAVDENFPGYDESSSYFYCTGTSGVNRSIRYYSDGTNPDPTAPPTGSLIAGYPNLKLYVAPIPTTPQITVNPEAKDFGTVIINTEHVQQFSIANTGAGTLSISSITYEGDSYFQLQNLPAEFPVDLLYTDPPATFEVKYLPTVAGTHSGTVTITDNRGITTIDLDGVCVDPRIASLPHSQNFDGVATPNFPLGWTGYKGNAGMSISTSTGYAQTTPNSVYMYNSSYTTDALRLISPQILVPMNSFKVSFQALTGTANSTLKIGTVSALDGTGVFTEVATLTLPTTYTWTPFVVSFVNYTGTDQYLCFQHGNQSSYQSLYLDTVLLEELMPIDMAATSITGYPLGIVGTSLPYSITVTNNGTAQIASYTVYLKKHGDDRLASQPVDTPLDPGATATHIVNWTPTVAYLGSNNLVGEVEATGDGNATNNESAIMVTSIYPEGSFIPQIGDITSTTTTNMLPFDLFYKNNVCETIYLPHELQMTGGTIQAIVYQNNFTQDLTKPVKVWMKHTTAADVSAGWLDSTDYTLVYEGDVHFPLGVNAVIIPLQVPFVYTGGNLAIRDYRIWENVYWSSSNLFYYTASPENPNRTRYYYADDSGPIDPLLMLTYGGSAFTGTLSSWIPNTAFIVSPATPITALDAPVVTATVSGTDVALNWPVVAGAYSYRVYASDDPYAWTGDPIATVHTNSYTFTPGTETKQFFKVVAITTYRNVDLGLALNPAAIIGFDNSRVKAEPPIGKTDNKD